MRSFCFSSFCLVVFFAVCCTTLSAKPIEVRKALQIIKNKEKTISSVSWECSTNHYQSNKTGKMSVLDEYPFPAKAKVSLDAEGRYRIEKDFLFPKTQGTHDVSYTSLSTFDGKTYRLENSHFASDKSSRIDGYIFQADRKNLEVVNWNLDPEGIGFFFPYFSCTNGALKGNTKKLSEYLEYILSLKRSVFVDEDENGVWWISVQDYIDPQDNFVVYVQIEYDPAKGKSGAVLSARVCDTDTLTDKSIGAKTTYLLQELGDFFVPKTVKQEQLMGNGKPSRYVVYEYDNIKINNSLSEDDFVIDWKKDTAMIDYVAGQSYVVSDSPVEEAEAVRHFMSLEGISQPPAIQDRSLYFRIVLIVLGLSLIFYALYSRYKKKKNVP